MRRSETKTPDDLERPEGNSLVDNYELHDEGEQEFIRRCERLGLDLEPWGIDMRHDDGEDGVIYDDAMDFKVFSDEGELRALVDVKTKSSPKWMGRYNLRHYDNYYDHAIGTLVPAYVVMFQVDGGGDIVDEFVHKIGQHDRYEDVVTSRDSDAVRNFPDGNHAALVKHVHRGTWTDFERDTA